MDEREARSGQDYLLGHSPAEIRRLVDHSAFVRPITERLLDRLDLKPGMRVLDVGCGAGDVALLARQRVGPSGSVIGVDRNGDVIETARARAAAAGSSNLEFQVGTIDDLVDDDAYDLVIGRYVLTYQPDPVAFLRTLGSHVRPGGALAFHEASFPPGPISDPPIAACETLYATGRALVLRQVPSHDAPERLVRLCHEAGLPRPALFGETPVEAGSNGIILSLLAEGVRSTVPMFEKLHIDISSLGDVDTLSARMRDEADRLHSQVFYIRQVCGWCRF